MLKLFVNIIKKKVLYMKVRILTIFPDLIRAFVDNGIFNRAIENNILTIEVYDLREFTDNRHKSVDDYSFGGGAGMVLKAEPFFNFFEKSKAKNVIFPSPQGVKLNNKLSRELSQKQELTFICGHYEGVDERVIEKYVDLEVSLGDYVLSGGELPSLVIMDSILRFIPEFIKKASSELESFEDSLLDNAVYTRPSNIDNEEVPNVLISGNHSHIEEYRKRDSIYRTLLRRPDLLKNISDEDKKLLKKIIEKVLNDLE